MSRRGAKGCKDGKNPKKSRFVAALDVGTTSLKCIIFDDKANVRGQSIDKIELLYPKPGWVEIDPDQLWNQIKGVIKSAIEDAHLKPDDITCMGISTHRCSFLFWDANNNSALHNIITWQDCRASDLVQQWNNSTRVQSFRIVCKMLYTLTKNKRYLLGTVLKLMNELVIVRLLWVLKNIPKIKEGLDRGHVKFGTLDTFILYKLTKGEKYMTDYSNAAPTGMFDAFLMDWTGWGLKMFGIPFSILPPIVNSCGNHFGCCKIFEGVNIPIMSLMADQSASIFGSSSFSKGDIKLTLGTGAFLDVNTGHKPHASVSGVYPLVGWKTSKNITYLAEAESKDNGTIIEWGLKLELYDEIENASNIAQMVTDSNGVYFIPAFNGLQAPYNDRNATAGFIGMNVTTRKPHLVRALLESLAFRVQQLISLVQDELEYSCEAIRVDGGVAKNDFLLQTISNLSGMKVIRPESTEVTALGCALMAGLHAGVWTSQEELSKFYKVEKLFLPEKDKTGPLKKQYEEWKNAIDRFLMWSNND